MLIKILGEGQVLTAKGKDKVRLNFLPLMANIAAKHGLKQYLFAHWNKALQLPAYYDPKGNKYYAAPETNIEILAPSHFWEGVERVNGSPLPSSCLIYPNAVAEWIGAVLVIDSISPEKTTDDA
jgi:hypothetical protein